MASNNGPQQAAGSTGTFTLIGEDYTLANALRYILNVNPHVEACGFSAPHPSEDLINLEIQTTGRITAKQALKSAAMDLKKTCEFIKQEYNKSVGEYEGDEMEEDQSDDSSDE